MRRPDVANHRAARRRRLFGQNPRPAFHQRLNHPTPENILAIGNLAHHSVRINRHRRQPWQRAGRPEGRQRINTNPLPQHAGFLIRVVRRHHHIACPRDGFGENAILLLARRLGENHIEGNHRSAGIDQMIQHFGVQITRPRPAFAHLGK